MYYSSSLIFFFHECGIIGYSLHSYYIIKQGGICIGGLWYGFLVSVPEFPYCAPLNYYHMHKPWMWCAVESQLLTPRSVQVNNVDFANIIREEAVLFLLDLPKGEEVTILAQKKKDGEHTFRVWWGSLTFHYMPHLSNTSYYISVAETALTGWIYVVLACMCGFVQSCISAGIAMLSLWSPRYDVQSVLTNCCGFLGDWSGKSPKCDQLPWLSNLTLWQMAYCEALI